MNMMDYIMTSIMLLSEEISYDEKDKHDLYQTMLRREMEILEGLIQKFPIEYNREVNLLPFKEDLVKLGFDFDNWGIDSVQISHGSKNEVVNICFDYKENKWELKRGIK